MIFVDEISSGTDHPLEQDPHSPNSAAIKPRRILVVDDEPTIRSFYSGILLSEGYEVDTADNGNAGWRALQKRSYDVVITDRSMPGLSGPDLFRKTRTMPLPPPVILATGVLPLNDEGLPFDAVLLKPFYASELVSAVEQVLGLHQTIESPASAS